MIKPRIWALIAGGGTAGHVVPGLAIAEEIQKRCESAQAIHYLGSRRGIETSMVPQAGFCFTALPGRGITRTLTWRNLTAIAGLCVATVEAIVRMARWRPAVVVGLGGFASVPGMVAAIVWRVPLIVAEQNATPSAANRLGARFAKASAVSFADVDLPRSRWTGNPVRSQVREISRAEPQTRAAARQRLNVDPHRKLVSVFGGSLGARKINEALFDALVIWNDRGDLAIRHISGSRDHAELRARLDLQQTSPLSSRLNTNARTSTIHKCADNTENELNFELVEFENDMAAIYAASDLVVCRAGASTVAELTVAGVPAILIPLPGSPGDHQSANAHMLEKTNAAKVVPDDELDGERLVAEVDALLKDEQGLASMSSAAQAQGRPDAAEATVDLLERYAKRPLPKPHSR